MQLTQKKSRRGDLLTAAAVAVLLAVMWLIRKNIDKKG